MERIVRLLFLGTRDCKPCLTAKAAVLAFLAETEVEIATEFIDLTVDNLEPYVCRFQIGSLPTIILYNCANQSKRYPEDAVTQNLQDFLFVNIAMDK